MRKNKKEKNVFLVKKAIVISAIEQLVLDRECGNCIHADESVCEFAGEITEHYKCHKHMFKDERIKMQKSEDLSKLPKWARSRILVLEQNNLSLKEQLDAIFEKSPTNVYVVDGLGKQYLPKNSQVTFILDGHNVSVMFRDDSIEINGMRPLEILPRAANSIYIKTKGF